jgi:hypothetical protein
LVNFWSIFTLFPVKFYQFRAKILPGVEQFYHFFGKILQKFAVRFYQKSGKNWSKSGINLRPKMVIFYRKSGKILPIIVVKIDGKKREKVPPKVFLPRLR